MNVIVTVCAAFGLTLSEAKTEIMCLRTRGMSDATVTFSVEAAGQVNKQTHNFVYLAGNVNHHADLSIEIDRLIGNAWCSFRKYSLELYDRPSAPLELKIRMPKAEVVETMLYGCVTWSPRAYHYDTLRRAQHGFLTRCIGWRKRTGTDHPISYLEILVKTGSESIEAILRKRRILFAGFAAHGEHKTAEMRDVRRTRGECGLRGGARKRMDGLSPGRLQSFRHRPRQVDDRSSGRRGMT